MSKSECPEYHYKFIFNIVEVQVISQSLVLEFNYLAAQIDNKFKDLEKKYEKLLSKCNKYKNDSHTRFFGKINIKKQHLMDLQILSGNIFKFNEEIRHLREDQKHILEVFEKLDKQYKFSRQLLKYSPLDERIENTKRYVISKLELPKHMDIKKFVNH